MSASFRQMTYRTASGGRTICSRILHTGFLSELRKECGSVTPKVDHVFIISCRRSSLPQYITTKLQIIVLSNDNKVGNTIHLMVREIIDSMRSIRVTRFNLFDTIECGQTFTWRPEGEGYINSDLGQVVYVEQRGDKLLYETSSHSVKLRELFRLDDKLYEIQQKISRTGIMQESIAYAPNLRIVQDPFFPCLISFICSTQKGIPAIHTLMNNIRERYGQTYTFRGKTYFGFPTSEQLADACQEDYKCLGAGYRSRYIHRTIETLTKAEITEDALKNMDYTDAHRTLKGLHGVGDKVADCVCLFSLGFLEAFPIDVWIERVIRDHYPIFTIEGTSYAKKSMAAREYFGEYAGYAQEYLYYYSRSHTKKQKD